MNLVYIGTYTDPNPLRREPATLENPMMGMAGPTGSEGIYVYEQGVESGALTLRHTVRSVRNPSFLAFGPDRRFLFAVNEAVDEEGEKAGEASSFAVDPATGNLRFLSRHRTGGGNPCHLSADPSGRWLLVANHQHGRISVLRIGDDGTLGPIVFVDQHQPTDPSGKRPPHAHFVTPDPQGRFILSTDTGVDRVFVSRLDPDTGHLSPNEPPWGETHAGAGPRHLAFHPNGRYVYANGEADKTLTVFAYDPERGALTRIHAVSTVPEGVTGGSTAQVVVHPNGRFVYVSNRGHDSIAIFSIDPETGRIARLGTEPTQGTMPRNFNIDPAGRFLYAANQNGNSIVCFRIDPESGRLSATGHVTRVGAPTCVLFER